MKLNTFAKAAWGVLFYNMIVILWGALVRATGSGAGCGGHWPTCNGIILPQVTQIATAIEFTHRIMSGISLLSVLGLCIWAFRAYEKGHPVRMGASFSVVFIFTEALVGAGLVLFNWVAQNISVGRTVSISIHLVNTFLLLGSLTLTAWWASGGEPLRLRRQGATLAGLLVGLLAVMLLGMTGAITALGDTLFPATSLVQGMSQDFDPNVNFLLRLRVWHPVVSAFTGMFLLWLSSRLASTYQDAQLKRLAWGLAGVFLLQLAAGITNLILLAPVWMQLIHLMLADTVWVLLVLVAAQTLKSSRVDSKIENKVRTREVSLHE